MIAPAKVPSGMPALTGEAARNQQDSEKRSLDPLLARAFKKTKAILARSGSLAAEMTRLFRAVERAFRRGLAEGVVDLVETDRTLRENGLHPVEEWLRVSPFFISNRGAFVMRGREICAPRRTLGGRS